MIATTTVDKNPDVPASRVTSCSPGRGCRGGERTRGGCPVSRILWTHPGWTLSGALAVSARHDSAAGTVVAGCLFSAAHLLAQYVEKDVAATLGRAGRRRCGSEHEREHQLLGVSSHGGAPSSPSVKRTISDACGSDNWTRLPRPRDGVIEGGDTVARRRRATDVVIPRLIFAKVGAPGGGGGNSCLTREGGQYRSWPWPEIDATGGRTDHLSFSTPRRWMGRLSGAASIATTLTSADRRRRRTSSFAAPSTTSMRRH